MLRTPFVIALGLFGFGALAACGSLELIGEDTPRGDASAGDGSLAQGEGGPRRCSSDLHDVIDDTGKLVKTCPDDQGCAGGVCVPACTAAAAARGSMGCDYIVATPEIDTLPRPPCFAVFVANSWSKPVKVSVSLGATSYDATTFGRIAQAAGVPVTSWAPIPSSGIGPGQVGVLFMSDDPSATALAGGTPLKCPVAPAVSRPFGTAVYTGPAGIDYTGRGQAFHITTDLPTTAYDIVPYGGAISYLPSAELLYPSTAWGVNYFGIVPARGSRASQWGQVVAAQDNTTITVFPNVSLPAGPDVAAAPANVQTTYTLNAGEFIQWEDTNEMSSTIFQADHPIAFNGGHGHACYTSKTSYGGGCDSAHQAVMPISAFGHEYAVAPYTTRRPDKQPESIPYRIVGAVKGTVLVFDPPLIGAPTALNQGQVVDFETDQAFVVSSQDSGHPFYIAQIMPGNSVISANLQNLVGDDEYVNLLPPAQFTSTYVFFTDPSYKTTNLVVTRKKTADGFQDVTLDCAGTLTGWRPIGATGAYEMTNVDLVREKVPNGACDNGPHKATSRGPFGVMVWGLDLHASYAYPAGGGVGQINTVVVPPQAGN